MGRVCMVKSGGGHRWVGCGIVFRRRRWMVGMLLAGDATVCGSCGLGTGGTMLGRAPGTPGGVMLGAVPGCGCMPDAAFAFMPGEALSGDVRRAHGPLGIGSGGGGLLRRHLAQVAFVIADDGGFVVAFQFHKGIRAPVLEMRRFHLHSVRPRFIVFQARVFARLGVHQDDDAVVARLPPAGEGQILRERFLQHRDRRGLEREGILLPAGFVAADGVGLRLDERGRRRPRRAPRRSSEGWRIVSSSGGLADGG